MIIRRVLLTLILYYFIGDGTDIDPSDSLREICSEVSRSLLMMVVNHPMVLLQGFLPSISNTCNGTCIAGVINQPINRELLNKIEKIMDLVQISKSDVSCSLVQNICMDSFFSLKVIKSVLLLLSRNINQGLL